MMLPILLGLLANPTSTPRVIPVTTQTISSAQGDEKDPFDEVIAYFHPKKASASLLRHTMQELTVGGRMQHKINIAGAEGNYKSMSPSVLEYGESLLVRDSREKINGTLELLKSLDERYDATSPAQQQSNSSTIWQYSVTHAKLSSIRNALINLYPPLNINKSSSSRPPQMNFVEELNMVVLNGSESQIEQAKIVVASMDVPKPRVMLSFYLIEGVVAASNDARVPLELAKDLSSLVPFEGFRLLSSAMLPSDTTNRLEFNIQLEALAGSIGLQMSPVAYDSKTETLTLDGVRVELALNKNGGFTSNSFTTSTSLNSGEYTVLGAMGANPIFVVIKLTTGH
ncbi:MAG: hypothetical protein ACI9F9_001842 [Candidatus Paceibacteria bacterium]|jgi:hypothetical protein